VNLWFAILVLLVAFLLEWHGYREGRKKGFEQGFRRGYTDANIWWLKSEVDVDEARQIIWKENP